MTWITLWAWLTLQVAAVIREVSLRGLVSFTLVDETQWNKTEDKTRTKESTKKMKVWTDEIKAQNVFNKNSLLIILNSCRALLRFIEHLSSDGTFLAITALSNLGIKTNPKFLQVTSDLRVRCSENYLNSLTAGDQSGERRDGRIWKDRGMGEKYTGLKNRKQNKWISRVPRSPECESGWLIKRRRWGGLCERVKTQKRDREE